ncbi:Uncharacterised protein [Enterobacter cloacae]|nr:Uncharacterised protein [Enterobacter cloacae]
MYLEGGTRIFWFATSVSGICTRSAARNKISLITFGHASASTQIAIVSPHYDSGDYCRLHFVVKLSMRDNNA